MLEDQIRRHLAVVHKCLELFTAVDFVFFMTNENAVENLHHVYTGCGTKNPPRRKTKFLGSGIK